MSKLQRNSAPQIVQPAKWGLPYAEDELRAVGKREQSYIVAIAVVTILAWQTEIGTLLLMPFTLLATWFHEMGHGLMAILLGADLHQLVIFANGSGYAEYSKPGGMWGLSHALIAAAGLLGPTVAGCGMIIASRSRFATQMVLAGLAGALMLTTLIWVRSMTGWIVLPAFAVAAFWIAISRRHKLQRFSIKFLGVQGAISVWQDLGYLYSDGGVVGGRPSISDTGAIADALILPYWIWGTLITAAILSMVWWSLRYARR